jgi:AcrR family transcriptional regulator
MRTRMPAPARREKSDSRARILDGAAEEFAQSGFAGARIDRIARRTKLNVRMIYYYFGSKKGLYRGVLESIYEGSAAILEKTRTAEQPAVAALSLYFDLLSANPRFADVLVRELLDGAKHLKALFKERPELFARVHQDAGRFLKSAMSDGVLRDDDPAMSLFSITSIFCYLTAVRGTYPLFTEGRVPDDASWKAHLTSLLLDGLRRR